MAQAKLLRLLVSVATADQSTLIGDKAWVEPKEDEAKVEQKLAQHRSFPPLKCFRGCADDGRGERCPDWENSLECVSNILLA